MSTLGECGDAAKSAGSPALLQEWAPVFKEIGLLNCLIFVSSHEGLADGIPTVAGLKYVVNCVRVWMLTNVAEAASMTGLEDVYANDADAAKVANRHASLAAMRYFHALAFKQKDHTAAAALATSSLGDTEARQDAEARRQKANAPTLAAAMREDVYSIYNIKVPPRGAAMRRSTCRPRRALHASSSPQCPSSRARATGAPALLARMGRTS